MPVDHPRKLVFVHIPKTAGTSIEKSLGICGRNNDGDPFVPCFDLLYGNNLQHLTLAEILAAAPEEWRLHEYRAFTSVRNPWDRILSEYRWRKASDQSLAAMTFECFIMDTVPARVCSDSRHFWPQARFVAGTPPVHELRFENLEADFRTFLGDRYINDVAIGKWNVSEPAVRYQDYFSRKMRDMVESCYLEDVVRFNYRF